MNKRKHDANGCYISYNDFNTDLQHIGEREDLRQAHRQEFKTLSQTEGEIRYTPLFLDKLDLPKKNTHF